MKPVDQTLFGDEGNCMQACIASVLELPLDDVPNFMALHRAGKSWTHTLRDWLAERGLAYVEVQFNGFGTFSMMPQTYHLIGGGSPRGQEEGHCIVGFAGTMVFDPHPSRAGLATWDDYGFFIHLFPRTPAH